MDWKEEIKDLKKRVEVLLAFDKIKFENVDWKDVKNESGVYVIFEGDRAIYVGESGTLRTRLRKHGNGNTSNDTFNAKLKNKRLLDKEARIKLIRENCFFIWRLENNRKHLEHFMIAALNPELND